MDINESNMYKLLIFWERFENGFSNINEVYFFMYGYCSCMYREGTPENMVEKWVADYQLFLGRELRDMFYPDDEIRNAHFGVLIQEFVKDDDKGVALFFSLLNKFANSH